MFCMSIKRSKPNKNLTHVFIFTNNTRENALLTSKQIRLDVFPFPPRPNSLWQRINNRVSPVCGDLKNKQAKKKTTNRRPLGRHLRRNRASSIRFLTGFFESQLFSSAFVLGNFVLKLNYDRQH